MIVKASETALPHLFLKGFRAPVAGTNYAAGRIPEAVGVLIAHQILGFDGADRTPPDDKVRDADAAFMLGDGSDGPVRQEAELATAKPELDVVIVDALDRMVNAAELADKDKLAELLVTKPAGTISLDRGSGFGPAVPRTFGWQSRAYDPRLALAGRKGSDTDPASLLGLDQAVYPLPDLFSNRFHLGNPGSGMPALKAGDRLRYTDPAAASVIITVPAGPVLSASRNEAPLDPPLPLTAQVDTVVFDKADTSVTLVWRAVFPWEERLTDAVLEVA